jgi:DNA-binding NarL/FixJ family response regulator
VVIADDHTVVREGLRALLEVAEDVEVVGEAASGSELVAVVQQVAPDVAIVDVEMPDGGIVATRELARLAPDVRVLVLTMHGDGATVAGALRAGARGYLVKGAGKDEVIGAVRSVARGEAVLGTGVADHVLGLLARDASAPRPFPQLTPREHDVLELIAAGHDNAEIALRLGLTLKSVRNNVASIYTKLQVNDRGKAVALARDAGLGRR